MKQFTLHGANGNLARGMGTRVALSCLYDEDDQDELLDLEVGQGFKDADGDQWERTA